MGESEFSVTICHLRQQKTQSKVQISPFEKNSCIYQSILLKGPIRLGGVNIFFNNMQLVCILFFCPETFCHSNSVNYFCIEDNILKK